MNSENDSLKPVRTSSSRTPTTLDLFNQSQQEPHQNARIVLEIPGRIPSWNEVLGMEHWARYKLKNGIQEEFLCALRASARDSSTKITSAKNIMLIAAETLALYRATALAKRKSRRDKLKSAKVNANLLG